eukprot:UN01048
MVWSIKVHHVVPVVHPTAIVFQTKIRDLVKNKTKPGQRDCRHDERLA